MPAPLLMPSGVPYQSSIFNPRSDPSHLTHLRLHELRANLLISHVIIHDGASLVIQTILYDEIKMSSCMLSEGVLRCVRCDGSKLPFKNQRLTRQGCTTNVLDQSLLFAVCEVLLVLMACFIPIGTTGNSIRQGDGGDVNLPPQSRRALADSE